MKPHHQTPIFLPFFLLITILTASYIFLFNVQAQDNFKIDLATDKPSYYLDQTIYIYGNLTLNNNTVNDALVGIEVVNPADTSIIIRTAATGDISGKNWLIEILNVTPCDQYGTPQYTFTVGKLCFFNITVKNNDIEIRNIFISVNIYDSTNTPIGITGFQTQIYSNSTGQVILSLPLPKTAVNGKARAYANIYSLRPKQGGKPYGPEKSAEFNITGSTVVGSPQPQPQIPNGNFYISFHLSPYENAGTYQAFATSMYNEYTAIAYKDFLVKVPGDANGDFRVDVIDLSTLGIAWWSNPNSPNWNPACDFNQDNRVDVSDLAILGRYWGYPRI